MFTEQEKWYLSYYKRLSRDEKEALIAYIRLLLTLQLISKTSEGFQSFYQHAISHIVD